jgi:predicted XRE-type DNA-binding protein
MADEDIEGSGNIFADLGLKNPDQELLKAKLTLEIYRRLKEGDISQADAAKLLGTTQPQVSALMRLKPTSISIGRLMQFLTILGQDVEVSVKPSAQANRGKLSFRSAAEAA